MCITLLYVFLKNVPRVLYTSPSATSKQHQLQHLCNLAASKEPNMTLKVLREKNHLQYVSTANSLEFIFLFSFVPYLAVGTYMFSFLFIY